MVGRCVSGVLGVVALVCIIIFLLGGAWVLVVWMGMVLLFSAWQGAGWCHRCSCCFGDDLWGHTVGW
jgi:hypothetical protein